MCPDAECIRARAIPMFETKKERNLIMKKLILLFVVLPLLTAPLAAGADELDTPAVAKPDRKTSCRERV